MSRDYKSKYISQFNGARKYVNTISEDGLKTLNDLIGIISNRHSPIPTAVEQSPNFIPIYKLLKLYNKSSNAVGKYKCQLKACIEILLKDEIDLICLSLLKKNILVDFYLTYQKYCKRI